MHAKYLGMKCHNVLLSDSEKKKRMNRKGKERKQIRQNLRHRGVRVVGTQGLSVRFFSLVHVFYVSCVTQQKVGTRRNLHSHVS